MTDPIRVGVSSCLLGQQVRYDGGHKHDTYITGTLGRYFDFVPVCPEVECGLPVPREAMHLEGEPSDPHLITIRSGIDHTQRMREFALKRVRELEAERLCGFIFKSKSPSSGLFRVKIHGSSGAAVGRGLFAAAVTEHFPLLPVEEEGRLHDMALRENFIERIFACHRLKLLQEQGARPSDLVDFHTREKLLVMSHSVEIYRQLGRLVADAGSFDMGYLLAEYGRLFMKALALQATVKKQTNVLQHVMGYFKRDLTGDEKAELLEVIERYRNGFLPLVVPVTLLTHYVRKYGQEYLALQTYLNPHPAELMLRNHV